MGEGPFRRLISLNFRVPGVREVPPNVLLGFCLFVARADDNNLSFDAKCRFPYCSAYSNNINIMLMQDMDLMVGWISRRQLPGCGSVEHREELNDRLGLLLTSTHECFFSLAPHASVAIPEAPRMRAASDGSSDVRCSKAGLFPRSFTPCAAPPGDIRQCSRNNSTPPVPGNVA